MNFWNSTGQRAWTLKAQLEGGHPWLLASFYEHRTLTRMIEDGMITPDKFRFFLDSGAYSAWSRGAEIDLDEYIEFIRANIEWIDVYANLDCLAGKPGQMASPQEREAAAAQGWINFLYMKDAGLDPIPVYHIGEDVKWLEKMLDYGCSYIGLGGLVGVPSGARRQWLDGVFDRITDEDGSPIVKTHGFGMTAVDLIFRYPWYSVDSTTWIKITANGAVYLPARVDGKFVFDRSPTTVAVSDRNPRQANDGKHANSMPEAARRVLDQWLTECGVSYADVNASYYYRAVCNVTFFKRVSEEKAARLFDKKGIIRRGSLW